MTAEITNYYRGRAIAAEHRLDRYAYEGQYLLRVARSLESELLRYRLEAKILVDALDRILTDDQKRQLTEALS